jgi:hypothetical protein
MEWCTTPSSGHATVDLDWKNWNCTCDCTCNCFGKPAQTEKRQRAQTGGSERQESFTSPRAPTNFFGDSRSGWLWVASRAAVPINVPSWPMASWRHRAERSHPFVPVAVPVIACFLFVQIRCGARNPPRQYYCRRTANAAQHSTMKKLKSASVEPSICTPRTPLHTAARARAPRTTRRAHGTREQPTPHTPRVIAMHSPTPSRRG